MTNAQEPRTPTIAAQIEALAAKASQGDWQQVEHTEVWDTRADGEPGVPLFKGVTDRYRHWGRERDAVQVRDDAALVVLLKNNLPAIVTALRQAEAAPGVEAAMLLAEARNMLRSIAEQGGLAICADQGTTGGDAVDMADRLDTAMRLTLARQHGAREDAPPSADAAMVEAIKLTIADASYHLEKYRPHVLEALKQALASRQPVGVEK